MVEILTLLNQQDLIFEMDKHYQEITNKLKKEVEEIEFLIKDLKKENSKKKISTFLLKKS